MIHFENQTKQKYVDKTKYVPMLISVVYEYVLRVLLLTSENIIYVSDWDQTKHTTKKDKNAAFQPCTYEQCL